MMKTKYNSVYLLILLGVVFGNFSCKKFLDVPPQGQITGENYWQSRQQALASVAGMYSNLGCSKDNWQAGQVSPASATKLTPMEAYIYWGEIRGELLTTNIGITPANQLSKENIDAYLVGENDMLTQITPFYRIINIANQVIKNAPLIPARDPAFSETESQQFAAEGYFVRAFCYLWLTRTFKGVPLVLNPSETDAQDYNIAQSSQQQVLEQIVKDLELAKVTLPLLYTDMQYQHVRANKFTAMSALADTYLWLAATAKDAGSANAFYDKAIENCDGIINSGKYFLMPGTEYDDIWNKGDTDESIFETFGNNAVNGQSTSMFAWFLNNAKYWVVNPTVDNLFNEPLLKDYRGSVPPVGPIPKAGTVISYDPSTRLVKKWATNNSRWVFYRYADILLMKAEAIAHRFADDAARLTQAAALVNQVRARAFGVSGFTGVSANSTFEMDNALLDERAREFIAEGRRWFDLVRFGSRDNFLHPELLTDRVVASRSGSDQLLIGPRVINPESWYFPFNAADLAVNPNLVQNPYYK